MTTPLTAAVVAGAVSLLPQLQRAHQSHVGRQIHTFPGRFGLVQDSEAAQTAAALNAMMLLLGWSWRARSGWRPPRDLRFC